MKIDFGAAISPIRKRQWSFTVFPNIFIGYERFQDEYSLYIHFNWLVFNSVIHISW